MSQRQVNLKGGDITSMYTSAVSDITKTVANIQENRRAKSKQAILDANKTTEEFVKTYNKQTSSTNQQLDGALNSYIREQAELIGNAKFKAQRPGATDEDRENYKIAEAQGKANLDAIAKWSVLTEQNGEAYTKHSIAVENNSMLGRLSSDALNNNKLIQFETALLSNQTQGIKIQTGTNGGTEVIVVDASGKEFKRNIFDDVQAFTQTGGTLAEQSINDKELLTGEVYKNWDKEFFSNWGLQPTTTIYKTKKTEEDGEKTTETTTTTTKDYIDNIAKTVLDDHKQWFEETVSTTAFAKNWDQLVGLNLIPDEGSDKIKGISWNTLHNKNPNEGFQNLKDMMGDDISGIDPTPKTPFRIDDYYKLREQQDKAAMTGLANLIAFKKGGEFAEGGFEETIKLNTPY
jgi:hypothetical protein